jgi:hypothetical protein
MFILLRTTEANGILGNKSTEINGSFKKKREK